MKAVGLEDEAVAKGTGENQILSLSFVGALADLARQRLSEAKEGEGLGTQSGFKVVYTRLLWIHLSEALMRITETR